MIVKYFLDGVCNFIVTMVHLVPSFARPVWLDNGIAIWVQVVGYMEQLNNWVPLGAIGLAASFISVCWITSVTLRIMRIAYSMFSGGGGATG